MFAYQDLRGLMRSLSLPVPISRSQVHLTSLLVNGLPSCHLTPWRSGRVSSVPSSLHDQLVARSGTIDCRLLVESEVFETPAVIDAVGHDSRVLQVRPAAGCEPHSGGGADVHHLQPIFARSP